jgi:C4-type Zn-finger protein
MKELTKLATLLGEDNEKRFKDAMTDLLINQFEDDLQNMSEYMCDYEEIFDEVRKEVTCIMKDKITKAYIEKAEAKFAELFGD